jgi:predicted ATPase
LTSAGDYGIKPATQALNKFIRNWKFYDFDPDRIRSETIEIVGKLTGESPPKVLNERGESLRYVLSDWNRNAPALFQDVNRSFEIYSKFRINASKNGDGLSFFEGYTEPIPIDKISDGTLRLLAYLILINQPELPTLIAIEEPERNLHPAWLSIVSDILNQLSTRTQVIITTHSSQLLDTFTPKSLQDNLGVLLLHNIRGTGTEVIILDRARQDKKGLQNWIDEFGIGSAIFNSEMFQDVMLDSQEA